MGSVSKIGLTMEFLVKLQNWFFHQEIGFNSSYSENVRNKRHSFTRWCLHSLQIKRYSSYTSAALSHRKVANGNDKFRYIFNITIIVVISCAVPFLIDPFNSVIRNTFLGALNNYLLIRARSKKQWVNGSVTFEWHCLFAGLYLLTR